MLGVIEGVTVMDTEILGVIDGVTDAVTLGVIVCV